MYKPEDIRTLIVPIPRQVTGLGGQLLELAKTSKFSFCAPSAEKGPVKTAVEEMRTFLSSKCGVVFPPMACL